MVLSSNVSPNSVTNTVSVSFLLAHPVYQLWIRFQSSWHLARDKYSLNLNMFALCQINKKL